MDVPPIDLNSVIQTSVALGLMVWLYVGLRARHWKKTDEMDEKLWRLVEEKSALREQIARNGIHGDAPRTNAPTRQDATD